MKFLKITTGKSLDSSEKSLSPTDIEVIETFFGKFDNQTFEVDGIMGSFISIHENDIPKLCGLLTRYFNKFKYEDITKQVLYGRFDMTPYNVEGETNLFDYTMSSFITSNLDIDTVLNKIIQFGMDSLSSVDTKVLNNI